MTRGSGPRYKVPAAEPGADVCSMWMLLLPSFAVEKTALTMPFQSRRATIWKSDRSARQLCATRMRRVNTNCDLSGKIFQIFSDCHRLPTRVEQSSEISY